MRDTTKIYRFVKNAPKIVSNVIKNDVKFVFLGILSIILGNVFKSKLLLRLNQAYK